MNIAKQWFSEIGLEPQEDPGEILVDNLCFVMKFYDMSKQQLDNLYIPEYIILRDYSFDRTREQNKSMEGMFKKIGGK